MDLTDLDQVVTIHEDLDVGIDRLQVRIDLEDDIDKLPLSLSLPVRAHLTPGDGQSAQAARGKGDVGPGLRGIAGKAPARRIDPRRQQDAGVVHRSPTKIIG